MVRRMQLTAERQKRYIKEGRGTGIGSNYIPWIFVARSEISSTGFSSILIHNGRQHHFLSNGETTCFLLATQLPHYLEVREQFPLSLGKGNHEVNVYYDHYGLSHPGTLEIARTLGIRHPKVPSSESGSAPFIMSTDLLITLKINGEYELVAVSYKPKLPTTKRALELLQIEKAYWEARGVKWLFITYDLFGRLYSNELMRFRVFALDESIELDTVLLDSMVNDIKRSTYSYVEFIRRYISQGFPEEVIKKAFWSGHWYGVIPLIIEGNFNPLAPMQLMEPEEFLARNPIHERRSSCI